ncbi:MAG: heat-inducible transcription repressor HrcA [Sandaracinaceae bacterium]|nr:heat-inducible transcription repressor HrcA [Sandaracinaceae bacterium]
MSERQRRILFAAVTEYIATGEPVASRRLQKTYEIDLSPATIRNVLSDLEEAGYLVQPHTSSGRVPSETGFRAFVDALVSIKAVSTAHRRAVGRTLGALGPHADLVQEAGELLSSLTGAVSVITRPRPEEEELDQLRFMLLRAGQVLAVLVTRAGTVQNRVLPLPEGVEASELERLNNYLAEHAPGKSLRQLRDFLAARQEDRRDEYDALRVHASALIEAAADSASSSASSVVIEGQQRLFDRPEFGDAGKIRSYMRAFEDRERLLGLLDDTLGAGGVQVLIGTEANLHPVEDISLIATRYDAGQHAHGTLGVVGPTRMDYAQVVPLVRYTASFVSDRLSAAGRGESDGRQSGGEGRGWGGRDDDDGRDGPAPAPPRGGASEDDGDVPTPTTQRGREGRR